MVKTACFSYYSSPDGEILLRSKTADDAIVPFGCYYDPGEVHARLKIKLANDFYPLIPIIQSSIETKFEIPGDQISWEAWITSYDFPTVDINGVVKLCDDFTTNHNPEYFHLLISIDCRKEEISFGTQVAVYLDKIHWSDPEGNEEFLIWEFTVAGVTENIDELFSREALARVVENVITELEECYKIELKLSDRNN